MLEAQVSKRVSPTVRVQVKAVSQADLPNGGTILGSLQFNKPQYGIETLLSTDGGLLGLRGLYNFGGDASPTTATAGGHADDGGSNGNGGGGGSGGFSGNGTATAAVAAGAGEERERIYGRFSAGGEIFYGVLNKSAGASLGARFATLPSHRGTPLTATLTLAPLMGNISASFAAMARDKCSLSTRFDFNFYSYESDWTVGMELWGKGRMAGLIDGSAGDPEDGDAKAAVVGPVEGPDGASNQKRRKERSFQAKMEWRLDDNELGSESATPVPVKPPAVIAIAAKEGKEKEEFSGVLKARMDQHFQIGLLWEGRLKSLIFGLGTSISLSRPEQSFRSIGLEIQYSS
jgi:distribution and morphology protein 10